MSTTVISSPGKVLVAGGYLVLDRAYSGLVVATSSRFYSSVTSLPSDAQNATISARAGQFPKEKSTWNYKLSLHSSPDEPVLTLSQTNEAEVGRNKFIGIAVTKVLEYAYESILLSTKDEEKAVEELLRRIGGGLEVVVFADNDFYSQREQLASLSLPARLSSLPSLPPFTPLPRPIPQTNKTGLGSSAALTTSLTASLLVHLAIVPQSPHGEIDDQGKDVVHAVSQLAHCLAQGKVGSGFDVSSAVYGSHVYTRFSPEVLAPLMDLAPFSAPSPLLEHLDPGKWDSKVKPFRLPKGLRLVLADVDAGTDTPSFVGQVLKWRKEKPEEAGDVWGRLDGANNALREVLMALVGREGEGEYEDVLGQAHAWTLADLSSVPSPSPTMTLLRTLAESLLNIRALLREMSDKSGVGIEPEEQSRLLDACGEVGGVLGGGVPGAGGYDALYLLTIDHPAPLTAIDDLWANWNEMDVCPLGCAQSDGGLRGEDVGEVKGLVEALGRV
ncbi:phosphomevalonate kinase [Cryptococcus amylolentus CBS 6039]|uniref:Phosphomevalonate kinase n=1 Tax=Cryptococcus amylolentus CBS 6039 TaxID=1295533 RepID=A0A1E3H9U8_9TREE|nr:phosphomevalonate kinase [Cryptococcus amylolentus CBS 6039]ODN73074.1 phosphomevalonate kinase [Cryptococcus amylolentus CBS 6039]